MSRWDDTSQPREDPSVAAVEQLFNAAASPATGPVRQSDGRVVTPHALWICACVTEDESPTWLIFDNAEERGIVWSRVSVGVEPLDLVDAQRSAGGHADPAEVLRWARGEAADPWERGGDGVGDAAAIDELGRKIRRL